MSRGLHPHSEDAPVRPASAQTAGLPMEFGPDIRTPAPSVAGSDTSALAADAIDGPFRSKSQRKIMLVLAAADGPMSRADIAAATELPINVVCARVDDLRQWLEFHAAACPSSSKAGLKVDGITLNTLGVARVRRATEAA